MISLGISKEISLEISSIINSYGFPWAAPLEITLLLQILLRPSRHSFAGIPSSIYPRIPLTPVVHLGHYDPDRNAERLLRQGGSANARRSIKNSIPSRIYSRIVVRSEFPFRMSSLIPSGNPFFRDSFRYYYMGYSQDSIRHYSKTLPGASLTLPD